jgi:hypothetical protein
VTVQVAGLKLFILPFDMLRAVSLSNGRSTLLTTMSLPNDLPNQRLNVLGSVLLGPAAEDKAAFQIKLGFKMDVFPLFF